MKQLLLSISAVLLHMSIMAQSPKVVLISGAKYGIGKSTALIFAQNGYTVYATDKDTTDMQEHKQAGCKVLLMDITNEQHIADAMKQIIAVSKTIDVLVNNAGYGQNGVVEELPMAAIRKQFEVNVFGHIRVTQEVLPLMREKRDGRIIMVGSLAGEFTMPGSSAYHASKHALESFTDALRAEVNQFNIKVSLIKPILLQLPKVFTQKQ
jgi:NADP-dependent 3-hydroxy acid dehydrogenase YdfG